MVEFKKIGNIKQKYDFQKQQKLSKDDFWCHERIQLGKSVSICRVTRRRHVLILEPSKKLEQLEGIDGGMNNLTL